VELLWCYLVPVLAVLLGVFTFVGFKSDPILENGLRLASRFLVSDRLSKEQKWRSLAVL